MTTHRSYGREGSNTKEKNELDQEYWTESVHTILSYWFCVLAVGFQFVIGIIHIDEFFGQMCIAEGLMGLSGLLLLDILHGKKTIYPKPFKRTHPNTFYRFAITFGVIALIQFLFLIVPLITREEMALAIVFCAVCEEYFFRGMLLELVFRMGEKSKDKFIIWRYKKEKKKPDKEMSYIELFGIVLSAIIFSAFHVNYYNQPRLLLMVFVGGLWLGFVYWWNKDLTAVILAHFSLNIIFVMQFYQVFGL